MLLNNRELSITIWGLIFIIWVIIKVKKIHWGTLLKTAFSNQLLLIYCFTITYVCLSIYGIYRLHFWDAGQIKNTIVWFFTTCLIAVFKANDNKEDNYFKRTIKDILSFTVITEFILSFYTFHIAVELLLVPLVMLITATLAYSELDKKNETVSKILSNTLSLFGIILFAYATYQLVRHFSTFATKQSLQDFLIPIILSILFIPYIFSLSIYIMYQDVFINMDKRIKSNSLLVYAKWQTACHFGVNKKDLLRWKQSIILKPVNSKKEIDASINHIKQQKKLEKHPPFVPEDKGWSPYLAGSFLLSEGIKTGHYQNNYEEEWFACSDKTKVGDSLWANDLAYYIEGNNFVAHHLQLVLTVFSPEDEINAKIILLSKAKALYKAAIKKEMSSTIQQALIIGKGAEFIEGVFQISVRRNNWALHPRKAYNLNFTIRLN